MNVLPREKQVQIIHALTEGCSIRAVERMTGVHRDTIMRLLVRIGDHCMSIMDDVVQNVPAGTIEIDEIWTFVKNKDRNIIKTATTDPRETGSQFVAIAMDRDTKLVLAHQVGKRVPELAYSVVSVVSERVSGKPTIITDGWDAYFDAVSKIYGRHGAHFGQLVKVVKSSRKAAKEGYTPAKVVTCREFPIYGDPQKAGISTSRIERQNWTVRTNLRRLTRLSNGFSRKLDNLKAAVAAYFVVYNFCRIHKALKITPAMAAGITDHVWDIEEIVPQMKAWSYNEFIRFISAHGFALKKGSSTVYEGVVDGERQVVTIHYHNTDIPKGTLQALIRQTGLPKKLFR